MQRPLYYLLSKIGITKCLLRYYWNHLNTERRIELIKTAHNIVQQSATQSSDSRGPLAKTPSASGDTGPLA